MANKKHMTLRAAVKKAQTVATNEWHKALRDDYIWDNNCMTSIATYVRK